MTRALLASLVLTSLLGCGGSDDESPGPGVGGSPGTTHPTPSGGSSGGLLGGFAGMSGQMMGMMGTMGTGGTSGGTTGILPRFPVNMPAPPDGGTTATMCTSPAGADACRRCFDGSCCTQALACAGNQQCQALITCINGCAETDAACQSACLQRSPTGEQPLRALLACGNDRCATACSSDGGMAMCTTPAGANACRRCVDTRCCASYQACSASAPCTTLFGCLGMCRAGDRACQDACVERSPAGVQPLQTLLQCMEQSCAVDCG